MTFAPHLVACFLALTLPACATPHAPVQPGLAHAAPCERAVERQIAFTSRRAQDVLEVRAAGVTCANAVVTVSARQRDGRPVLAFAMPLSWLHEDIDPAKPLRPEELSSLLEAYAAAAMLEPGAKSLPAWKQGEQSPGFDHGMELSSPLERVTYETLRSSRPTMLCLRDSFESGVCYAWDRKAARADIILRR